MYFIVVVVTFLVFLAAYDALRRAPTRNTDTRPIITTITTRNIVIIMPTFARRFVVISSLALVLAMGAARPSLAWECLQVWPTAAASQAMKFNTI